MVQQREATLLGPCRSWLASFLRQQFRRATIGVLPDTDRVRLGTVLSRSGLTSFFPECSAWEVKVDVAGVVHRRGGADLVFVELKAGPISLRDVGQLLGYCRVCRPIGAFLLSPEGLSSDLQRLLTTYGRIDVLRFGADYIRVGSWLTSRRQPAWGDVIPGGALPTLAGARGAHRSRRA